MARIAWIGLGRIGLPMARRLASVGHEMVVWDLSPDAMGEAATFGALQAQSAMQAVEQVEAIFLCVPDAGAVETLLFEAQGVAAFTPREAIIIDHTSMSPDAAARLAIKAREEFGLRWVDAPISGGPAAAAEGGLVAWLGGEPADVEAAGKLIGSYVARCVHMGAVGAGQTAKSCNQLIVTSTIACWSQMLRYARALGLEPEVLIASMEGGAADSPVARFFARDLAAGNFPQRSLFNFTKDLSVVARQAKALGLELTMVAAALEEFDDVIGPDRCAAS
jgi:3-hydroxyisobutyrate dehydrogenase-like beta-hydroxyacid dehydrogenase